MVEQKGEGRINRRRVNGVVVVEDEDKRVGDGRNVVQQGGEQGLLGRRLGRLQRRQHACAHARGDRLQRGDEIRQKADRVAVAFVKRQPGDRLPTDGDPLAEQRGFTATGGSRNKRQLASDALIRAQPLVQAHQQLRTLDRLWSRRRDIEPGR